LLRGIALAVVSAPAVTATVTATVTAPPASATTCSATKPPLDAASKQIDRGDMLWVSHTGSVGITTPAGTGVVQVDNAGPLPLQALLVDAEQNAMRQLIVSNGRGAHVYLVSGCDITTVIDPQGAPFLFDLQNLRGNGTGIGCMDLGAGPHLAGLQATLGPTGWTVRRTQPNRHHRGGVGTRPGGDRGADNQLRRPDDNPRRSPTALSEQPFDPSLWRPLDGFGDLTDITYHRHIDDGTVRVAFNRPEVRNAFRPHTVDELYRALDHARMSS